MVGNAAAAASAALATRKNGRWDIEVEVAAGREEDDGARQSARRGGTEGGEEGRLKKRARSVLRISRNRPKLPQTSNSDAT